MQNKNESNAVKRHYFSEKVFNELGVCSDGLVAMKHLTDYKDEPLHDHDFIEIVYILSGKGVHFINGERFEVKSGDLLFINYGCSHAFTVEDSLIADNLMIKVDYFAKMLLSDDGIFSLLALSSFEEIQSGLNSNTSLVSFYGQEKEKISLIFKSIKEELSNDYLGKKDCLNSYIDILVTDIFRKIFLSENKNKELIPAEIVEHICEHCGEKISLSDLAKQCFYTPSYFSRLFKKVYRMTLTEFIAEQRLLKCCELITSTGLSIEDISAECGFTDRTRFYTLFKKKYGCTPAEYRNGKHSDKTDESRQRK